MLWDRSLASFHSLKLIGIFKCPIIEVSFFLDGVGHSTIVSWSFFGAFVGEHFVNIPTVRLRGDIGDHIGLDFLGIEIIPVNFLKEGVFLHVFSAIRAGTETFAWIAF